MSEENVEIVRLILAEWEQGNFGRGAKHLDPQMTFETFMPDASESVIARGFAEVEAFTREWLTQWRDYRIVGEEFEEVAPDKVFVAVRQIATGEHSGAPVESPGFSIWTLRRGKVVRLSLHYDRGRARQAAGLSE